MIFIFSSFYLSNIFALLFHLFYSSDIYVENTIIDRFQGH
jgi:hypothetical protein